MEWTPFTQMAGVLAIAAVVAAAGLKLRQPLIISFLLAGVLVGPSGIGLIKGAGDIELLAEIGIALLLFVVGLRLDIGMIRTVGPVALATGLGQVLFTSAVGLAIALAFGMKLVTAVYVAVALTFSSTIIIVKLLSDKKEIDSLHGRIAVGFLIVQDIMAILALIGLTAFGGGGRDQGVLLQALWILAKGLMLLGTTVGLMWWVLPRVLNYVARSQELLVLFAITWAIALSAVADRLGFSKEVGAFIAGVSLASGPQRDAIGARLVVLRDFLLLFFFINLGAGLDLSMLRAEFARAAVFSIFVLVGNPLIVMAIMGFMGYRKRTGFMSGLAVAQISEFSLILAALGLSLGHIDAAAMSLITLVGLVTICSSTYMILYSGPLYNRLSGVLSLFERKVPHRQLQADPATDFSHQRLIIVLGLGNFGGAIAALLKEHDRPLLAVDFDPQALQRGRDLGLPVLYGDIGDPEMLDQLPLDGADWVLCTSRDHGLTRTLLNLLAGRDYRGRIAVTAADPAYAEHYHRQGAHLVLRPFTDAAEQAVSAITGAVQSLPGLHDWPAVLKEIPLQPGSVFAGKNLRQLDLRRDLGVSILAVSRAGAIHFNPEPDFYLYPGDRLVLLCPPDKAEHADGYLRRRQLGASPEPNAALHAAEISLSPQSPWAGKCLADLDFRRRFGVTVIGIRRGPRQLTSPQATDRLEPGDGLIVVGSPEGVRHMEETAEINAPIPPMTP